MAHKMIWHGNEVQRRVHRLVASRLATATVYAARQVQQNIGFQGPPASAPGDYPHRQTGELQAGVKAVFSAEKLKSSVVCLAPHAEIVEQRRPFILRTIREIYGRLRRIMLGGS